MDPNIHLDMTCEAGLNLTAQRQAQPCLQLFLEKLWGRIKPKCFRVQQEVVLESHISVSVSGIPWFLIKL